jgi:Ca-activated chloride channel family protein
MLEPSTLEAIGHFHFLRPWWLLGLLPLALLIYFWIRRTREHTAWSAAISQPLLEVLLDNKSRATAGRLRATLWLSALIATIGLAGPAWEKLPQPVEQKNDALVIVLDLSLSMFAQDLSPSRLDKARQKIVDALRFREEGSTGLVAYAGDGHAVVPITDDRHTIENLLNALSPAMMPVLGSRPATGLELAQELFRNAGLVEGRILVLTDGIKDASEISNFRNAAFPISIIGIGTESGGTIPINRPKEAPRYLTDEMGRRVIARLNESLLIQAAQQSYGRYSLLTVGDIDLKTTLGTSLPTEDASIEVEREFDIWMDMGFWLCLPLALLMLASFHRGLFAALLLTVMLPEPSWAQDNPVDGSVNQVAEAPAAVGNPLSRLWRNLWLRPDQQAYRALQDGDPAAAARMFEDTQWRGSARYRSGDFSGAVSDFAEDSSARGLYNQGNALARLGRYPEAIERYEQVLQENPQQQEAAFNKALVEKLMEQQNQQEQAEQEQQNQQQQQQSQESQSSDSDEQQEQDQQESEEQESEQQPEESEQQSDEETPEQSETEEDSAQRDEKQEALEQWLRRVPDDPGGLLRRKFQHETKQRLRQGDYSNRQDEQVW